MKKIELFCLQFKNYSYFCSVIEKKRMEYTKENIEKAVCEYFKVEAKDLYSLTKREYPWGVARDILIYLLFAAGYKTYMIDDWFGFARTMVYRRCAKISVALKSDTKIKEDINNINKLLSSNN